MTTYFTSDTHFGHANIIRYCNRPFRDVTEMNEALIERWNGRVRPGDTIFHLGDFGFGSQQNLQAVLDRLQGDKHFILGNHDKTGRTLKGWGSVQHYRELSLEGARLVLFHYGARVWNGSHHGSLMLYGHSHGTLPGDSQSLDVGTDCWEYTPVTLEQIKRRLATLPPRRPPDHHGADL